MKGPRWGLLVVGASFLPACQPSLKEDECIALLDRYTEKVIEQARPSTSPAERSRLLLAARKKAELDPEFAECAERVSRRQFECAMAANSADQIERCLL